MQPPESLPVLAFRTGPWRFVVDVRPLAGLLGVVALHAAPKMPPALLGYADWRAQAVPVYALSRLLQADGASSPDAVAVPSRPRIVLVYAGPQVTGLLVDEVEQVLMLSPQACVDEGHGGAPAGAWSLGFCRLRQHLYAIFDVRALSTQLPGRA